MSPGGLRNWNVKNRDPLVIIVSLSEKYKESVLGGSSYVG
jgi:hypothetical protein